MIKSGSVLPEDELAAIDEYDYEQARILYEARLARDQEDFDDVHNHYLEEVERSKALQDAQCEQELEQTRRRYQELADEVNTNFQKDFNEIVERQQQEIKVLQEKWTAAKEEVQKRVNKEINEMLKSSKELAKTHKYEEAIGLRDKAFSMKQDTNLPQFQEVNQFYQNFSDAMLARHKIELEERRQQYDADIQTLQSKCDQLNIQIQVRNDVSKMNLSHELIADVLNSDKDTNTQTSVVRMLSPRSQKSPFSRTASRQSLGSSNSGSPNKTIPRSPNRLGSRNSP